MVCLSDGTSTNPNPRTMYDYITISVVTYADEEFIHDEKEIEIFPTGIMRTIFYVMLILKHYVEEVTRPPPSLIL